MKKVLLTFLSYGINVFGGVERSIYNLIQGLRKNNIDVVIYTGDLYKETTHLENNIYFSRYLINNFEVDDINKAILQNYRENQSKIKNELIEIVHYEQPDYILAVDHIWGIIPHVNIFDDVNCPVGIVFHMLHDGSIIKDVFRFPFMHIFSISNYVKTGLEEYNEQNKSIHVLPNCIGEEFFKNKHFVEKKKIFCNARIADGKGIQILIEAFLLILDKYPQCELYLCNGNFHFMKKIQINNYIDEINKRFLLPKIILLPNINWDEMSNTIEIMDVVVLPTEMETFGLGALETIATGVPLITTKAGNLPELLQDSAFYLNNISKDDIYAAIVNVFTNLDLVNAKREKGFCIAQRYIDLKVAREFIDVALGGEQ